MNGEIVQSEERSTLGTSLAYPANRNEILSGKEVVISCKEGSATVTHKISPSGE
ncbi:hypothetical protein [Anabaena sp. CCY 9910]|uniref:hypothetical protein n=1 Tax=Anabaena sp. CCY 9910 TaxID=3103870 RepID=UPI0039E007CA